MKWILSKQPKPKLGTIFKTFSHILADTFDNFDEYEVYNKDFFHTTCLFQNNWGGT